MLLMLVFLFAVISVAMAATGHWFYQQEIRGIRTERYNELKVGQLVAWRGEWLSDAKLCATETIGPAVLVWMQATNDPAARAEVLARLRRAGAIQGWR